MHWIGNLLNKINTCGHIIAIIIFLVFTPLCFYCKGTLQYSTIDDTIQGDEKSLKSDLFSVLINYLLFHVVLCKLV